MYPTNADDHVFYLHSSHPQRFLGRVSPTPTSLRPPVGAASWGGGNPGFLGDPTFQDPLRYQVAEVCYQSSAAPDHSDLIALVCTGRGKSRGKPPGAARTYVSQDLQDGWQIKNSRLHGLWQQSGAEWATAPPVPPPPLEHESSPVWRDLCRLVSECDTPVGGRERYHRSRRFKDPA